MSKTEIFIVTFRRDFTYLQFCLRSIAKFATGFSGVSILVPEEDEAQLLKLIEAQTLPCNVRALTGKEWPGLGMIWHMAQIMRADQWCPEADFIAHIDADCMFTEPVTPDDYVRDGKPILRFEYFSNIAKRHPGCAAWQEPTQRCLPFLVTAETMRCHPGVYHRRLYEEARAQIEKKTGQPCDDYIKAQRNSYPQGFCEFVTLGNVALHCFPNDYVFVEQTGDKLDPPNKLRQFWSHRPLDEVQRIWIDGAEHDVVPLKMIHEILK